MPRGYGCDGGLEGIQAALFRVVGPLLVPVAEIESNRRGGI